MIARNQEVITMHVSNLKRFVPYPSAHPPPTPPSRERGVVIAVVLLALVLLAGSLWLSRHGVSFLPCGEDLAAACG